MGRSLKHKIIASNIANVDTPYYKSKEVTFQDCFEQRNGSKIVKKLSNTSKAYRFSTEQEGRLQARCRAILI